MHTRTSLKRALALLLTVAVLVGVLSVGAFAATADNVRHYDTYVCLGDSIAEGYGPDNQDLVGLKRVPFAYHSYVADAVTADKFYPMARPGGSTSEVLYFLDSTVPYDASYFRIPIAEDAAEALRIEIQNAVQEADLITLNVGSNDIFTTTLFAVAAVLYADTEIPEDVQNMINNYGDYGAAFQQLYLRAAKLGKLPEVVKTFTDTFTAAYQQFRSNWNQICKRIYELNPDVTLVAVGFFNPVKSLRLSGNSSMEIGQLMDTAAVMMNTFVRYNADYARQYLYADVYNTECYTLLPVDDPEFGNTLVPNVHPTHEGHKFMAQQILAVLPERSSDDPTPGKTFPFKDVPQDSWFYDDVYYVWDNDIMQGMTPTTFDPQGTTTRAQFATVLYRMAGSPAVSDADRSACPFTDLTADWYRDAVVWAYKNGVVNGVSATRFDPNAGITREQLVTMLYRYEGSPESTTALSFADAASISPYARAAVAWAVENGIVNGMPGNTFQPKGSATRAQLAAILHRFMAQ